MPEPEPEPEPSREPAGPKRCDALTARGIRCRREGQFNLEIDGRVVLLCIVHHRQARHGSVTIHDYPLSPAGEALRPRLSQPGADAEDERPASYLGATDAHHS